VHALLTDFLPADKYFRLSPLLGVDLPIDEKNKSILSNLKHIARYDRANVDVVLVVCAVCVRVVCVGWSESF
jgi:hypothetical protein